MVDQDLSARCFANRRNHDDESGSFLQDFAKISWPAFCKWQRENRDEGKFPTLLRTDISAFYDSISHQYLTHEIAHRLMAPMDSKLMKLFCRLLQVRVLSYNHVRKEQRQEEPMHQGLCIGNSTEGFFANIYLARIDQEMGMIESIDFGRYNDDMRIFAKDRPAAEMALLALQERLLTKGLNLNSSKTKFAEGEAGIEGLRSKDYEWDDYSDDDDDSPVIRPKITDKPFDEFKREFKIGEELPKAEDAKDFCHFLSKRLALSERKPGHIEMLQEILTKWHGSAKHAAWRLIESFARQECPRGTRDLAEIVIMRCLTNPSVANYTKYRLLHHLVKTRGTEAKNRYCEQLRNDALQELKRLLPSFLGEVAFELNIISLYAMRALGASFVELENAVEQHACKPVPLPIRNALALARGPKRPKLLPVFAQAGDAETEVEDYY